MREGLYYNPYFVGGAIAMPKMLADGGTEYDDGTEATESQQAKVLCLSHYYYHVLFYMWVDCGGLRVETPSSQYML